MGKLDFDLKTIIIIIGAARSGSTLLAKAIGGHSECFTLGEINRFNQEIENPDTHCGCGELLCNCSFWRNILTRLNIKFGTDKKLKNNFEVGIFKQITKFTKIHKLLPTIIFKTRYQNHEIESELNNTYTLYEKLFKNTHCSQLIDSTKGLFRALILESRYATKFEVKFVHILRDGRGVLNSEMKSTYKVLHNDGKNN